MITASTEAPLRDHVAALAGDIGERHVFRPRAFATADASASIRSDVPSDFKTFLWLSLGHRCRISSLQ
jgi:hypothetical protein